MRPGVLLFLVLGCAGCSKIATQPPADQQPNHVTAGPEQVARQNTVAENPPRSHESHPAAPGPDFEQAAPEELRAAAEAGVAPAQRELAARMLLGKGGMPADPAGALVWVERAARRGDQTAALWMGRKHLNEPPDRMAAAAWFLLAAEGGNAGIRQDAGGELEALALSARELDLATALKAKLAGEIAASSE